MDLSGLPALQYLLASAPNDVKPLAKAALYEEAAVIFARSQTLVPVRTGVLKSSGMVSEPKEVGGRSYIDISYGGPAASYAMWVHEKYNRHAPPTDRKYLQRPVEERMPYVAQNIAERVENMIRSALRQG